jgi:2-polyprenyl-6-methoxyphenol hydroxylase-like FAD-dependent oxidoreductase
MMGTSSPDVDVLIVGAGLTGLGCGLALGRQRVTTLVVDSAPAPADHPRARGVRIRANEILRLWGLDHLLRAWSCRQTTRRARPIRRPGAYAHVLAGRFCAA